MAQRLVLHIGPRKTGTTYLQRVLQSLAPELQAEGVLYPTRYREGKEDYNHVGAVTDITHSEETRHGSRWSARDGSQWANLCDVVNAFDGTAILSAEMLGGLRPPAARTFMEGFRADRIDIVITMRDLGRIIPSSWQQHVRNTHTQDYKAYLKRRARERGRKPPEEMQEVWDTERNQTFWRGYAYGALVRRWQSLAGTDRVRVVTLPPAGSPSRLLWERFREALDIDALPQTAPQLPNFVANVGSTEPEALFLHAFNVEAKRRKWNRREANDMQQRLLASGFLDRAERGRPLLLPHRWLPKVQGWAQVDIDDLRTTGAPIFGDLADLQVLESSASRGRPDAADAAAVGAYAAIHSLDQEVQLLMRQRDRESRLSLPGRAVRRLIRMTTRKAPTPSASPTSPGTGPRG